MSFLIAVCVLCAAPAIAQAAWTPRVNVSGPVGDYVFEPDVGFDAGGDAVLMWQRSTGIETRVRRADGRLTEIQSVAPPGSVGGYSRSEISVNSAGDAAYVWIRSRGYIEGRIRHADGTLGPVLSLARESYPDWVSVGMTADGGAVFSWSGQGQRSIKTRTLSPSGTLGPVQGFGRGVFGPGRAMGVASTGQAVFGWLVGDAVWTSSLSPTGELGPRQRVSAGGRSADWDDMAVNENGDAIFVWHERMPSGAYPLFARFRLADGTLSPRYVLRGGRASRDFASVALNSSGEAVACYYIASHRFEARTISSDGTLGPARRIARTRRDECSTAINEQGNAVFGWTTYHPRRIYVRWLGGDGRLTPAHIEHGYSSSTPLLVANPAGGFMTVWDYRSLQIRVSLGP